MEDTSKSLDALAIVPARGGSEGAPRKNLATLAGESLIARAVRTARAARHVGRVVVTTDDEEIADAARAAGAETVHRPAELATPDASSESALLHALAQLDDERSLLAFLQCTAPLLTPDHVDRTLEHLVAQEADACFAAVPGHAFAWQEGDDGTVAPLGHPLGARARRQAGTSTVVEAGSVYAMRRAGFVAAKHRFFGRVVAWVEPGGRRLEIDDPEDLVVADALLTARARRRLADALPRAPRALVLDFDGVFTDGTHLLDATGGEQVQLSRRDGAGVAAVKRAGVHVAIVSAEANPVVLRRAEKLGVPARTAVQDKAAELVEVLADLGVDPRDTVYVGDDVADVPCFGIVGCAAAPADAHPDARRAADIVLAHVGGRGAVREVCDAILARGAAS